MIIRITKSFRNKLNDQVEYIAKDKISAARKFKSEVLNTIRQIPPMPFKNRKSIFFDRDDIRDLTYKGYIIVYKFNKKEDLIEVFGFTKYQEKPFKR
ncbi:MAG: type II toxin-antitoxin system RelE/ParE family toxin [Bacteroidetes bacterium]|nr:type II toxin-antitoxin system RelE/ParE family toxin [Bacteroidota bacterium]MBT7039152.1 type II toxin-antitoxin system RelE/ParE family toxin [Bacteroidota bacterium]MBT7995490.1 type II toxin-antitoxin system RelE/ParE family toxin [Bacteroidota bacterium]